MRSHVNFLLILLIFIQSFSLLGCSIPNNINTNIKTFAKKSDIPPDSNVCNTNSFNFSLSKYKVYKTDKVNITVNLPATKYQDLSSKLTSSVYSELKYILKISKEGTEQYFEKELGYGCNNFEWDLKDSTDKVFDYGEYNVQIYFRLKTIEGYTQNYDIHDFYNNLVSPQHIAYCNNSLIKSESYYNQEQLALCSTVTPFLSADEIKLLSSKQILVSEEDKTLPEGTEFFEVADFQKIVDLTSQLNVQTNSVNSLYAKYKQLEAYKDKKISLQARPQTTEITNKISQMNNEITSLETAISVLASNVSSELSTLNNRKDTLANHINTITKKQYITFAPADKPDSVGSYSDSAYFSDLDLSNLLSDGITLYAPDEDDPDQENLKEVWEVDQERVEVLDPTNIFDGAKALSDEIQTAKYLISDIQDPNTILDEDKLEAIETLNTLLNNIKNHSTLFTTRAKKFSEDYKINHEKLSYETEALKAYFLLQLAEVNNKLESSDAFSLQSLKTNFVDNNFSIKLDGNGNGERLPSQKAVKELGDKYLPLAIEYLNEPLFDYEKTTREFYGISIDHWEEMKRADSGATKALEDATIAMARACLIPTTRGDAIFIGFTFFREAKALSKINVSDVKNFTAQSKVLKNQASNITTRGEKNIAKVTPKVVNNIPCFNAKAFHTQGFSIKSTPCELFLKKAKFFFPKVAGGRNNKGIKEFGHYVGKPEVTQIAIAATKKLLKTDIEQLKKISNYPVNIIALVEKFKNDGIVREAGTGFAKFSDYVVKNLNGTKLSFTYPSGFSTKVGNAGRDFDFITSVASPQQLGRLINKTGDTHAREILKITQELKLTWHHVEDLKTLQLIPRAIHEKVAHLGGKGIWDTIKDKELITITEFKNWLNGKLGS